MELVRAYRFPHVNMDLIAGLPADTPEGFRRSLDKCLELGADDITIHTLALKKGSRILLEHLTIPSAEAVGEMLDYANEALRAAVLAKRQGLNVRVINMPTIKPIDEEIILTAARECGRIITVEEHSIIGGLGEAVCSVVSEKLPVPVRRIGVMDQFGHSGPANEVLRDYGLTADNIVNVIRDIVRPDAKA